MPPPRWTCGLDPCDQVAMSMPGVVVCPDGWRCTDHLGSPGPGLGFCFGGAGRFGQSCGDAPTDSRDSCETGTFCAARYCAVADAIRKLPPDAEHPLPDADGVCAFPIHEGEVCDSDMADRHSEDPAVRLAANSLCAPCEAGTYCVSNLISGFDGPANEKRCIRRCEAPDGSRDPDLCSCNRASCTDRDEVINPITGAVDGRYFCDPCTEDNVRPCADSNGSPRLACCDATASCEAVTDLNGDPNHLCCRPPGTACDPSDRAAGHETCCYGSACEQSGRCESCAGAGQAPLGGECCPGLPRHLPGHRRSLRLRGGLGVCRCAAALRQRLLPRDHAMTGRPLSLLVVSLTVAAGCYARHGRGRDSGANDGGLDGSVDARIDGRIDGGDPSCPWLGPYRPCGDGCAHDPDGNICRAVGEICYYAVNLCFPRVDFDPRGVLGCAVGHPDPHPEPDFPPMYCWDGKPCLAGQCVDDSVCRQAPDFREGMHCVYSDGTLFDNGPPYPDTCPSPADPRTPFCGGPCGECPVFDYGESGLHFDPGPQSGCIGLSETRGLGICTFYQPNGCFRGSTDPGDVFGQFEFYGLGVPACLVLLDPSKPDGFEDIGTPTMASSCRAWLSRFPDAPYACLDQDWNPIP